MLHQRDKREAGDLEETEKIWHEECMFGKNKKHNLLFCWPVFFCIASATSAAFVCIWSSSCHTHTHTHSLRIKILGICLHKVACTVAHIYLEPNCKLWLEGELLLLCTGVSKWRLWNSLLIPLRLKPQDNKPYHTYYHTERCCVLSIFRKKVIVVTRLPKLF